MALPCLPLWASVPNSSLYFIILCLPHHYQFSEKGQALRGSNSLHGGRQGRRVPSPGAWSLDIHKSQSAFVVNLIVNFFASGPAYLYILASIAPILLNSSFPEVMSACVKSFLTTHKSRWAAAFTAEL